MKYSGKIFSSAMVSICAEAVRYDTTPLFLQQCSAAVISCCFQDRDKETIVPCRVTKRPATHSYPAPQGAENSEEHLSRQ